MAELGLLAPDTRMELIDGEIIDIEPHGEAHACIIQSLGACFVEAVGARAVLQVRGAVHLDRLSRPEVDLALLAPRAQEYAHQSPTGADTLLIVEIAERSLDYMRDVKVPLYARHGVPEVWVLDLNTYRFDFFRGLAGDFYTELASTNEPGIRALAALPGAAVDLSFVRQLPRVLSGVVSRAG